MDAKSTFEYVPNTCKIRFHKGAIGFSVPRWHGYPVEFIDPASNFPEITVKQGKETLGNNYGKRSFGACAVGKKSQAMSFAIRNDGTAPLRLPLIKVDGKQARNFIFTNITMNTRTYLSLSAGESVTFRVRFKPARKGISSAIIHIKNNDSDESTFDIKLIGKGIK